MGNQKRKRNWFSETTTTTNSTGRNEQDRTSLFVAIGIVETSRGNHRIQIRTVQVKACKGDVLHAGLYGFNKRFDWNTRSQGVLAGRRKGQDQGRRRIVSRIQICCGPMERRQVAIWIIRLCITIRHGGNNGGFAIQGLRRPRLFWIAPEPVRQMWQALQTITTNRRPATATTTR